ncbi:MAG TPA: galactokinase [Acidimicrobiia bacterium]|nr:galactokinase [Acidimicrobiia bacterium]
MTGSGRAAALRSVFPTGSPTPRWWRAPGRVNLIGDHTDYAEGFVLPMAIDRDCLLAVASGESGRVRARSLDLPGVVDISADGSDDPASVEPAWGRFVAGATRVVTERAPTSRSPLAAPGLELAVGSTIPPGSGLSSSSALAVALVLGLADAFGIDLDRTAAVHAAFEAEILATGVPSGLMDQLTSLHGVDDHALLIDCRSLEIAPIPLPSDLAVLVVHSGMPRTLVGSAYAERRAATEAAATRLGVAALRDARPDQVRDDPRARHVVSENARVLAFADALRSGDHDALGPLLLASHASLRDDFEVSTPELDALVETLVASGASGARLTGAGFGGCVVALSPADTADEVLATTVAAYRPPSGGAVPAFRVRAVAGAGLVPDPDVAR